MAFTFYKKDDREYAELADEIQRDQRQLYFHRDGEDYTSPKEHVRFQIFEPMPMDVVAVDQAAENDIPMELTAGMENLRLNREENSYNLKATELHRNPKMPYQVGCDECEDQIGY
ncbi:hypothetical protein L3Y34_014016 [Caenorhabditis briggsae]|uniref:Uncharacterized protein n=1 Tax=Caenorhabditis briggsae TaxID=6238 RepID=A0AAE9IXK4_CAEBR|nr:hypothetical protein L3Y34_014016 [Caenorhabditis briggsae]